MELNRGSKVEVAGRLNGPPDKPAEFPSAVLGPRPSPEVSPFTSSDDLANDFDPSLIIIERRSGWQPAFSDYLYTSSTNATAFSPTDTMPITGWAKLLMSAQSLSSFVLVVLVTARAVNILK